MTAPKHTGPRPGPPVLWLTVAGRKQFSAQLLGRSRGNCDHVWKEGEASSGGRKCGGGVKLAWATIAVEEMYHLSAASSSLLPVFVKLQNPLIFL